MKKRIIKIITVICVAFNFLIQTPLSVKAEYTWPNWYNRLYTMIDSTYRDYESVWMYPDGSQSMGTSMVEKSAVYKHATFISIPTLMPGAKIRFSIDFKVTGMRPSIATWRFYLQYVDLKTQQVLDYPINAPGDYAKNEQYTQDWDNWKWFYSIEQFEFINTSTHKFQGLKVVFEYDESQNLLYSMQTMNNLAVEVSPTEEQILQDTNNKVGGIFETVKNIFTGITNLPSNIANSVKGFFDNIVSAVNKIQTWLVNLLDGIIQGLKSLFIPSDDYFKNYFDSLYDFFSEKLGILIMPVDILISLMNNITNLQNGDGYIHVPPFEFMGVNLIPKTDYNLKVDVEKVLGNYYDMYYLLTDVIIYFMLFNMAKKKFESIVGGNQE